MIGKKIPNPKKTASKAERASGLSDYILCRDEPHKLLYAGARGFLSATEAGHVAEMIALATDAVRSRDPISHYVLSWRENERPSAQQIEQAIDIFETETGLAGHQLIYGLHHDTDNLHLHIAVNRAHPVTGRVIKVNGGFDIEAIHRVVARVEAAQGWARETNGRYAIDHAGELTKVPPERGQGARTPSTQAQDYEARTGSKSAERIAQEQAAPIMRQATTWAELHAGLAAQGIRYERKGSGAVLWVGAQPGRGDRKAGSPIGAIRAGAGGVRAPSGTVAGADAGRPVGMEPLRCGTTGPAHREASRLVGAAQASGQGANAAGAGPGPRTEYRARR
jgi:Relaxase/Mobilisation nuclease domain